MFIEAYLFLDLFLQPAPPSAHHAGVPPRPLQLPLEKLELPRLKNIDKLEQVRQV